MGKPQVPISVTDLKFSIEDIEDFLSGPPNPKFQTPYVPKLWKTKDWHGHKTELKIHMSL